MSEQETNNEQNAEREEEHPAESAENAISEAESQISDSEWPDLADEPLEFAEEPMGCCGCCHQDGETEQKMAEMQAKMEELEAQLAEARDQLLRKTADFENSRKRMNQEKQNAIEFANKSLLLDIIPVIDDFERAIQSAEGSAELNDLPAGKAMLDGITMIEKRLTSQLESVWGLKRYVSAGEPFDPNIHEAMFVEKSPDVKEAVVKEDFSKGYTLKDKVIRAAKVRVLMPEEQSEGSGE
jgi:molecular chaperone GrpE